MHDVNAYGGNPSSDIPRNRTRRSCEWPDCGDKCASLRSGNCDGDHCYLKHIFLITFV